MNSGNSRNPSEIQGQYAYFPAAFRSLPPFAPFARAAAALASDVPRPARAASRLAVPNTPLICPGTV